MPCIPARWMAAGSIRARDSPAGRVLRRLDHVQSRRTLQGRPRSSGTDLISPGGLVATTAKNGSPLPPSSPITPRRGSVPPGSLGPTLSHQHRSHIGEVVTVITIGPDLRGLAEEHPVAESHNHLSFGSVRSAAVQRQWLPVAASTASRPRSRCNRHYWTPGADPDHD